MNRISSRPSDRWPRLVVAALLALAALAAAPAAPALALDRRSADSVIVPAGQTVDDDLFANARTVQIDGTVNGDVIALARSVTVAGTIAGDLIAAAEQVVVDGEVHGNVRVAGATVQVNGAVARNVSGAGNLLQLGPGGRVGGSWTGIGDTISLRGDVGGALAAAGGDLLVQGRIGRGAEVAAGSFTTGPNARIGGDLIFHGERRPDVPAQVVSGHIQFVQAHSRHDARGIGRGFPFWGSGPTPPWRGPLSVLGSVLSVAWLAGSAFVGLAVLRLFPRFVAEFLHVLAARPLPSLGLGALALVFTLPAAALVALTIVGLPVAALLAGGYLAGIFVGWLLLAVAIGSILVGLVRRDATRHHAWSFLLGLVVLYAATRIPVVGGLVAFAGAALGLGALLLALYQTWGRNGPRAAAGPPAVSAA